MGVSRFRGAVVVVVLVGLISACTDGRPSPRAAPHGAELDLPEGDALAVGVGESSFLAFVGTSDHVGYLIPISVEPTETVVADAIRLDGICPCENDIQLFELADAGWVLTVRSDGTTKVVQLDERDRVNQVGAFPELEPAGFVGELPDGTVLMVTVNASSPESTPLVLDLEHRYWKLDLGAGTLTPTEWQPPLGKLDTTNDQNLVTQTTYDGCVVEGQLLVRGASRHPDGSVTTEIIIVDPDDPSSERVHPVHPPSFGYLVCDRDGQPTFVDHQVEHGSVTITTWAVNDDGQLVTAAPDMAYAAGLHSSSFGAGSLTLLLGPPRSVADVDLEVARRAAEGLPPLVTPGGFTALSFARGAWSTSPISPYENELVWVSGDGQSYVGRRRVGEVRTWRADPEQG